SLLIRASTSCCAGCGTTSSKTPPDTRTRSPSRADPSPGTCPRDGRLSPPNWSGGRMIRSAVILAAGRGSRLGGETSKPLVEVGGISLIGRVLACLRHAGVEEAILVLGYQGERLRRAVSESFGTSLRLRFVFNPDWERSNGLSVLAAEPE